MSNRKYKILQKQSFSAGDYQIVPIRDEDKFLIMKWRNEQMYHLRQNEILTPEKQEKYYREVVDKLFEQDKPEQILFSYLHKGQCIGYGGLVHINWDKKTAEVSFIMDTQLEKNEFDKHWSIFLSLLEQVAFDQLSLTKIFTYAYDLRPHLYEALEKNGFVLAQRLKNEVKINNKFFDVVIHEKIHQKNTLKIGVLSSGNLGFQILKELYKIPEVKIPIVFTDNQSNDIQQFSKNNNIKTFIGNPNKNPDKIKQIIKQTGKIDVLFSINYLFIIKKNLIDWPDKYALNIHGSLLPKYRGRTPHIWAIINGEDKAGITIHKMVEEVDAGDILLQKEIKINDNETGADILKKYAQNYPILIKDVISKIISNQKLVFVKQDESKATFFGKRTPDDGQINWNWQRQRIYNWIRAQAKPYPGAFSFIHNKKIVIHKSRYSYFGYHYKDDNGKILNLKPLIVKTPNGALEILDFEFQDDITKFKKGDILK